MPPADDQVVLQQCFSIDRTVGLELHDASVAGIKVGQKDRLRIRGAQDRTPKGHGVWNGVIRPPAPGVVEIAVVQRDIINGAVQTQHGFG